MSPDLAGRIADAEQAKSAMQRYLTPAFDVVTADYAAKLIDIAGKPLNDDGRAAMEKLALAVKVINEVRGQINGIVLDGGIARADKERADRIANMPAEQRRWSMW